MEPHSPYSAPEAYDHFKTPDDFPNPEDIGKDSSSEGSPNLHSLAKLQNIHAIERWRLLYAANFLYRDDYVGEFLKPVHTPGLDKNTITILTSDFVQLLHSHPKDFNTDEHRSLYDADLQVPLIIPGLCIPAGKRQKVLASHYYIPPTHLGFASLAPLVYSGDASLKDIIQGNTSEPPRRYPYAEESLLGPQYSIRNLRYKLLETIAKGNIRCFDGTTATRELHNICSQIPEER